MPFRQSTPPQPIVAMLGLALVLARPSSIAAEPRPRDEARVVVELFTSQGCSSCPVAEQFLTRLGHSELAPRVVPLAFHVDYWNRLGWTDPFSNSQWTQRQYAYARHWRATTVYTPQFVINGMPTDSRMLGPRLREALNVEPAAALAISAASDGSGPAHVHVVARIVHSAPGPELQVLVALFETDLATAIARGENGGRTQTNDYVVRSFTRAFKLPSAVGSEQAADFTLELQSDWRRDHLGVAAFVQHPGTLKICGSNATPLDAQ